MAFNGKKIKTPIRDSIIRMKTLWHGMFEKFSKGRVEFDRLVFGT